MKINFKLLDRDNPIVNIKGYMNVFDSSDYCMNFYDTFNEYTARIPLNPFEFYSDDYYDYVDLIYHFECDEKFMTIVQNFVESENQSIIIQRPYYDMVLEK